VKNMFSSLLELIDPTKNNSATAMIDAITGGEASSLKRPYSIELIKMGNDKCKHSWKKTDWDKKYGEWIIFRGEYMATYRDLLICERCQAKAIGSETALV